jgi:hypothetical protein
LLDAVQGVVDLCQELGFGYQEIQRALFVVVIGGLVARLDRNVRRVAGGIAPHWSQGLFFQVR